jgi:hypothetical protein
MNTTTPNNKISNSGATAQGKWTPAEANNVVDALNSKQCSNAIALTDAANIAVNASQGFLFAVTISASRNMSNPSAPLRIGQVIRFAITQGGGAVPGAGYGITWGSQYRYGLDRPIPILSDVAGKTDYVDFMWTGNFWDCMDARTGY